MSRRPSLVPEKSPPVDDVAVFRERTRLILIKGHPIEPLPPAITPEAEKLRQQKAQAS